MAVNSANSAKLCFERLLGSERSTVWCITLTRQLLAMFIASWSTFFYIIFRFLHVLLSSGSQSWMYMTLGKKAIAFHDSHEFHLFVRSQSCVEFSEKAALHKHSMWSSVATEILLVYAFGIALFFHAESVCLWASNSANNSTNYLLRNGCVWLMGVPAGFKLNTELARVLGMLSLNAIQIWSTLWFFVGSVFIYFVKGLAILGVLFGVTTPAALIVDMILLATLRVSTLHWLVSR
ncbi:N-acetylglucosaminyl transferase component family protein [Actinidia rufa]|uniref:N-acetylglucosaminyl transferase component family protein n=1 Tax=Actinidia rufa TaxID=165716 RepID=A0A7J0FBU5_9ERIC|nr:N-acetylglucosaminyl transferase component family protein [Actinidia rufa]